MTTRPTPPLSETPLITTVMCAVVALDAYLLDLDDLAWLAAGLGVVAGIVATAAWRRHRRARRLEAERE